MSDNGQIAVDWGVLNAHAGRVRQVAADTRLACDAAASLNLGGGAFGIMCAFLVPPLSVVSSLAQHALNSAAAAVERSATEVAAMGGDFRELEDLIGRDLTTLDPDVAVYGKRGAVS